MMQIATYNIQFSMHPREIIETVQSLIASGVKIICLQEVVFYTGKNIISQILEAAGPEWSAVFHIGKNDDINGMGNCILWNMKTIQLQRSENIILPYSQRLSLPEMIFSWLVGGVTTPFHRRIVVGYFVYKKKKIRITNIHLDHNGGASNRKKQLKYIQSYFHKNNLIEYDIICGDFNNLDPLNNHKEIQVYKSILSEYEEATEQIGWSADLNQMDTSSGSQLIQFVIQVLNIHLRKKLDFIWVKNMIPVQVERVLVKGSDHYPIVAWLDFK